MGVETYVVSKHLLHETAPRVPSQTPLSARDHFVGVVRISRIALIAPVVVNTGVVGRVGAVLKQEKKEEESTVLNLSCGIESPLYLCKKYRENIPVKECEKRDRKGNVSRYQRR